MAEKTLNMDVAVNVKQKDISDIATLEKRLKALQETYKVYVEMVEQGIDVDKAAYNIKELERSIQSLNRIIGEARKVMNDNSFGDVFKRYNKNLETWHKNMELYKGLGDKQTQEAKDLLKSARAAARDNVAIQNSMLGVFDFKGYRRTWLADKKISTSRRDILSAGKEQLNAEKQAAKDAASTWSTLYKEREGITKGLGKLSEASKKYATDAKKRLEAIDSEMSELVNKWSGNKVFDNTKTSVENKTTSANIISRLSELHSNETKSLASMMSDVKNKMGHLSLKRLSGEWSDEDEKTLRRLTQEYRKLEKAIRDVNKATGMSGLSKLSASIKGHLYWMISGDIVDQLQQLPAYIQHTTVEFDNLKRKIEQNIEMTEEFEGQPEKLQKAVTGLVLQAHNMANIYGMTVKDTLDMMQIMSRRFKDPQELVYFTDLAMIMSKLDFVTPAVAAESLEAVVLSFGLSVKEASDFLDQFTVATHTMRINGQDLLQALQRSAPMLKSWNMTTAEAVAIVSTLSTTLGREGTYIGTALNGMFARPLKEQNIKALESVGISFAKTNGEAKTGIELLREYHDRFKTLNENAQKAEVQYIFGTNRFAPAMSVLQNWELVEQTLDKIESKANRINTFTVLKVQMDSYESQLNRVDNSLKMMAYALGEELMPPYTRFIEATAIAIAKLMELDSTTAYVTGSIVKAIALFSALSIAIMVMNKRTGKSRSLFKLLAADFTLVGTSARAAASGVITLSRSLVFALGKFTAVTLAAWAMIEVASAIADMVSNHNTKTDMDEYAKELYDKGQLDQSSYFGALYNKYYDLDWQIKNNQAKYDTLNKMRESGISLSDTDYKFIVMHEKQRGERDQVLRDAGIAMQMEKNRKLQDKYFKNNADFKSIEQSPAGSNDTDMVGEESNEDKKFDKGTKMVLDAKTSKYKTDEEIAKKRFDSAIEDINYEEELLGKTPRTIMDRMHLRTNRKKELLDQYALINADIDALNDKLDKLKGKGDNDEAINDKGETTTTAKLRATYSKALDELRKLAVENEETRKEINRSIRKSYEVAYDKQVEEEKKRNETTKKLTLLSVDNKRNAWNDTKKNIVELEYERKNNAILVEDYKNSVSKREELEGKLFHLRVMSATEIARIGKESYEQKVKEMERELQIARDLEAEKLLLKEESNKKIEELEYKQTQKIREGLHNVVQELLLEGKSWKDIWKQLWTDLANEALRALMGIQDGSQSVLGALAANLGGLDSGGGKAKAAQGKGGKAKLGSVAASAYGGNTLGLEYAGGWISHDGSIIGVTPLNTRYYHNGGNVGTSVVPYLKSDEVNAVLQTGEEVVSRKDRRSNELMSEQNKHMADAMQRMAEGSNTNVTFAIQAIDSKSVVQLLSENGDAIMNILRKQSAYGNGRI